MVLFAHSKKSQLYDKSIGYEYKGLRFEIYLLTNFISNNCDMAQTFIYVSDKAISNEYFYREVYSCEQELKEKY